MMIMEILMMVMMIVLYDAKRFFQNIAEHQWEHLDGDDDFDDDDVAVADDGDYAFFRILRDINENTSSLKAAWNRNIRGTLRWIKLTIRIFYELSLFSIYQHISTYVSQLINEVENLNFIHMLTWNYDKVRNIPCEAEIRNWFYPCSQGKQQPAETTWWCKLIAYPTYNRGRGGVKPDQITRTYNFSFGLCFSACKLFEQNDDWFWSQIWIICTNMFLPGENICSQFTAASATEYTLRCWIQVSVTKITMPMLLMITK